MAKYKTPQEVLDKISDLRESHRMVRSDLAIYAALGIAYAHGRHWKGMSSTSFGDLIVDEWDENYDLQTREIRVVDNKVGPLLRRLQADLNPTRIEAKVETPGTCGVRTPIVLQTSARNCFLASRRTPGLPKPLRTRVS